MNHTVGTNAKSLFVVYIVEYENYNGTYLFCELRRSNMLPLIAGLLLGGAVSVWAASVFIGAPSPRPHISATLVGAIALSVATICGFSAYLGGSITSPVYELDAVLFFVLAYVGFSAVFWGDLGIGTWPPKRLGK